MCTEQGFANVFARVEKKYILTQDQAVRIISALDEQGFQENIFGSPLIQSIYYDTPDYTLVRRSIERPNYKEKLRLRTYGNPGHGDSGFIEIKKKVNGIVYKRRTGLPLDQARATLRQGQLPDESGQIGREIEWFVHCYPGLRPAAIIAYERRAFENPEQGLRLTFDANVRFRDRDFDLTHPAWGVRLLKPGEILMEVKVPGAYPLWLTNLIWETGARAVHFSKYGAAYTNFIQPRLQTPVRVLKPGKITMQEVRFSA